MIAPVKMAPLVMALVILALSKLASVKSADERFAPERSAFSNEVWKRSARERLALRQLAAEKSLKANRPSQKKCVPAASFSSLPTLHFELCTEMSLPSLPSEPIFPMRGQDLHLHTIVTPLFALFAASFQAVSSYLKWVSEPFLANQPLTNLRP